MEATLGLVYTAQQMAAGAADYAVVKVSPGAQGRSAEMTQPGGQREGRLRGLVPAAPPLWCWADNRRAAGEASSWGKTGRCSLE